MFQPRFWWKKTPPKISTCAGFCLKFAWMAAMASADGPPEKLRSRPTRRRPAKARPRPVKRCMALWWGWRQLEAEAKKTASVWKVGRKKNRRTHRFFQTFSEFVNHLKSQSRVCGSFPHQKNSLPKLLQISRVKKQAKNMSKLVPKTHPSKQENIALSFRSFCG